MATTEEKTELVETIKGPRFYRIQLNGYGGESAYMSISEKAHDFWKSVCEDHGDYDLSAYMTSDDDDEPEFENVENVPPEAKFLHDKDEGNYKRPSSTGICAANCGENLVSTHIASVAS